MAKSTEAKPDGTVRYYGRMPPSENVQSVRCLFCGKGSVWWECECQRAQEVRDGKRPKPKVVFRDGKPIIILDEEALANSRSGLRRYRDRPKKPVRRSAAVIVTEIDMRGLTGADPAVLAKALLQGNTVPNIVPPPINVPQRDDINVAPDNNVSRGRGQPRRYATAAERKKAYRDRMKGKPE